MRRRTFLTLGNEGIDVSKAVACDVCLYNKSTQKLLIVEASKFNITEYPSSNYSPVGVVVVPGNHNVYGDGSCAVMSLKLMDYETPDSGSAEYQSMYWGQYNFNVSSLTNYNEVCYVGSQGTVLNTIEGVTLCACLPSDMFTTVQNPYDKDTYFYYNDDAKYIPSPYNEDDTRNAAYYQTSSPSSSNNALSDFDGIGNTEILCSLATKQSDWKTASTITNNSGKGYSPAACCCWRYHTEGTKQGDWYLPAMGELGYIMPKLGKIQTVISFLLTSYGLSFGVNINEEFCYWSSTEMDKETSRNIDIRYGMVSNYEAKANSGCVRAFLRVK